MRKIVTFGAFVVLATAAQASPFAVGIEQAQPLTYHLGAVVGDPVNKPSKGPIYGDLTVNLDQGYEYYLEEPGVLLALLGAAALTDENRQDARDRALKFASPYARDITYSYAMVAPPDLPADWWFRYTYGQFQGKGYSATAPAGKAFANGATTYADPTASVKATRLAIVGLSPYLPVGNTGLFLQAQVGVDLTDLSLINGAPTPTGTSSGGLGTVLTAPVDVQASWRPWFLPWVEVQATGGFGVIDWSLSHGNNSDDWPLTWHWGYGAQAGTRWLQVTYQWSDEHQGSMVADSKGRPVAFGRTTYGLRLDLGELLSALGD